MRIFFSAVILAAGFTVSYAGTLEKTAENNDFLGIPFSTDGLKVIPVAECGAPVRAESAPSTGWISAVKKAYFSMPQGTLPPAAYEELPAAAIQQIQEDAHIYPSKAYKLVVDGRTAFFIENDNSYGLFVNIFDENGVHVAYGGFDENYDFYWLK